MVFECYKDASSVFSHYITVVVIALLCGNTSRVTLSKDRQEQTASPTGERAG